MSKLRIRVDQDKCQGHARCKSLAPELFDFDNRCKIHVNRNEIFNDFVRPSIADMLTDLRNRGDEQRLYWARLEL